MVELIFMELMSSFILWKRYFSCAISRIFVYVAYLLGVNFVLYKLYLTADLLHAMQALSQLSYSPTMRLRTKFAGCKIWWS